MCDGSVIPSSRTYSGKNGVENWKPTKAMNTHSASAHTLRCQSSDDWRGVTARRSGPRLLPVPLVGGEHRRAADGLGGARERVGHRLPRLVLRHRAVVVEPRLVGVARGGVG